MKRTRESSVSWSPMNVLSFMKRTIIRENRVSISSDVSLKVSMNQP